MQEIFTILLSVVRLYCAEGVKEGMKKLAIEKSQNERLARRLETVLIKALNRKERIVALTGCFNSDACANRDHEQFIIDYGLFQIAEVIRCGQCAEGDILILETQILPYVLMQRELEIELRNIIGQLRESISSL